MGHNSFIAIRLWLRYSHYGYQRVCFLSLGVQFHGTLRQKGEISKCISVQYKGTRLTQIFMLMVHEQEQHLPFARVVFFQAPTPVNSVTRGDIDEVKLSTAFPDKQNVFEIHTKSGLVWYLQSNSNVRISIILLTILL